MVDVGEGFGSSIVPERESLLTYDELTLSSRSARVPGCEAENVTTNSFASAGTWIAVVDPLRTWPVSVIGKIRSSELGEVAVTSRYPSAAALMVSRLPSSA